MLPQNVPGYGGPAAAFAGPPARQPLQGVAIGDGLLAPALRLAAGYDSAPDGAGGSASLRAAPSLSFADPVAGFGAYAGWQGARYPEDGAQDVAGATLAAGERWELPAQRITLGAGYLAGDQTGFALGTEAVTQPVPFAAADARLSDEITEGAATLTPALQADRVRFPGLPEADHGDAVERLSAAYATGGPLQLAARLQAAQSRYPNAAQNAGTLQALAGLADTADGLWRVALLAGLARRQAAASRRLTEPVLEAGLDWLPAPADRLRLTLSRELDDPDEIGAAPARLAAARASFEDSVSQTFRLNAAASLTEAAYLGTARRETLVSGGAGITWQASGLCALTASYAYNDRQANYLRAANEHVVTLEAAWTP